MERIDIAIIGGGVIGLAIAAIVAKDDRDVFIFEKNMSFGQEASSRNSEVIHSGIYYPSNSLKTKTCIEGSRMLYEICQAQGIPYKRIGKLIIAKDKSELAALEGLFKQGLNNGLEGLKMLTSSQIKEIEPNINAEAGIYLPMTGIIDSHSLMEYFLSKAKSNGADIVYDSELKLIDIIPGGYQLTVSGMKKETYTFQARVVVNCAGLASDKVSEMVGIKRPDYTLFYCKGDYFRIGNGKNFFVNKLIYPVVKPDDPSLGIHFTPDLVQGARLGPDAEYLSSRILDYSVDPAKAHVFYEDVKIFLPFLEEKDLSVDTSGIRAKLQGPGQAFRDFVVRHESEIGFNGFINLIGIESPGLTASPRIARMVKDIVDDLL